MLPVRNSDLISATFRLKPFYFSVIFQHHAHIYVELATGLVITVMRLLVLTMIRSWELSLCMDHSYSWLFVQNLFCRDIFALYGNNSQTTWQSTANQRATTCSKSRCHLYEFTETLTSLPTKNVMPNWWDLAKCTQFVNRLLHLIRKKWNSQPIEILPTLTHHQPQLSVSLLIISGNRRKMNFTLGSLPSITPLSQSVSQLYMNMNMFAWSKLSTSFLIYLFTVKVHPWLNSFLQSTNVSTGHH